MRSGPTLAVLLLLGAAIALPLAVAAPVDPGGTPTSGGPSGAAPEPPPLWRDVEIDDPAGVGMKRFHEDTACLEARRETKVVRIAFYGDSIIAGDEVTSAARQTVQARFGDGGHGFLLTVAPSQYYHRAGVRVQSSKYWWQTDMQQGWLKSGRLGYGGSVARTQATGAWHRFIPRTEGTLGGKIGRLVAYYEHDPHAGWLRVKLGSTELGRMDTRGPEGTEGFGEVSFAETDQPVQLELGGGGGVRLFGVAAERTGPGMVLDGLGLTGAKFVNLNTLEEAHWQRQLRDRAVSLVAFMYGANDGDFTVLPEDWYRKVVTKALTRLKPLRGQVGCLVITPIDRGIPWKPRMPSRPVMAHIEKVQEELARAHGCALLRLRDAMGGPNSARRWLLAQPPLMWGDVTHLRPAGAKVIGGIIGRAVIRSYESFKKAQGERACPKAPGPSLTSRP